MYIERNDSLKTVNPALAKQWHPTKNENLTPEDIKSGSGKKVWWKCEKGHEWQATINHRNHGKGCPYCSGRAVCEDNCLATINPALAKEWHPTKNGNLTPDDITPYSNKKVWWQCGKGHEWKTGVNNRSSGNKCPYCSSKAVCKDNCLATINPALAKEWHPTKNGNLTPDDITPGSNKKVWWQCEKCHEWQAKISSRNSGNKCPYCSGRNAYKDTCLATINPALAKEWHPTKNGNLTPDDIKPYSNKKVWWLCGKGHEWKTAVSDRSSGIGCPYCSGRAVCKDNCLATTNPALAKEWHPTKNGNLTPDDVTPGSDKKVWWQCGRGHEWQAILCNRSKGLGCPYCSGRAVCEDNSLATISPALAKEWHPTKNGNLTPDDITPGSNKKVWWQCGRGHEWKAMIGSRNKGVRCPFCNSQTSQLELRIFCEMKHLFKKAIHRKKLSGKECDVYIPELKLGIEVDGSYWHKDKFEQDKAKGNFIRNKGFNFIRIREKGLRRVSDSDIFFSTEENHFTVMLRLVRKIKKRFNLHEPSKVLVEVYLKRKNFANDKEYRRLWNMLPSPLPGYSLEDIIPFLAQEWHHTKNGNLTPKDVSPGAHKKIWWQCRKGHEWEAVVYTRSKGVGCPYCSGRAAYKENCLATISPALAKEWHPAKNGNLTPEDITSCSGKKVWWQCEKGHEWQATINHRNNGTGCPYCSGRAVCEDTCLATISPALAKEWHPTKNGNLTPDDITPGSNKKVWWQCGRGHEWKASVSNRSRGTGCSFCLRGGLKSKLQSMG